jgi:cobalamin transport system substrate-binding protein
MTEKARMRRRSFLAAIALAAAACGKKGLPASVLSAARRVVSLSPSTTEALFAFGGGALVVGRSRYCDYPPEVTKLPEVGGYVDPNFEAIVALAPDLVTGARGPAGASVAQKLEARGVATYFPETESFAAIDQMILGLGDRTGHAEDARRVTTSLDARVETIQRAAEAASSGKRPRVLLVFGVAPLSVAGPSSFADEMIAKAGAENVVRAGGAYPTLGVESVLALDPDVVVNAAVAESHGLAALSKETPGWSRVRAAAEGKVVGLADEAALRPGPRVADGLAALARAIHPGIVLP